MAQAQEAEIPAAGVITIGYDRGLGPTRKLEMKNFVQLGVYKLGLTAPPAAWAERRASGRWSRPAAVGSSTARVRLAACGSGTPTVRAAESAAPPAKGRPRRAALTLSHAVTNTPYRVPLGTTTYQLPNGKSITCNGMRCCATGLNSSIPVSATISPLESTQFLSFVAPGSTDFCLRMISSHTFAAVRVPGISCA